MRDKYSLLAHCVKAFHHVLKRLHLLTTWLYNSVMAAVQALQLQEGMRMTCSSGYCVPPERPELLSMCAAGTSRVLVRQDGQSALAPAAQAGRRLLVAVSQRS